MRQGVAYREESADELRDAGERCSVALVLRQAAAQEPQPVLPHLDSQGASRGEELAALVALEVSHSERLHGHILRTGVTQGVKNKHHAYPSEEQDDPTVGPKESRKMPARRTS